MNILFVKLVYKHGSAAKLWVGVWKSSALTSTMSRNVEKYTVLARFSH